MASLESAALKLACAPKLEKLADLRRDLRGDQGTARYQEARALNSWKGRASLASAEGATAFNGDGFTRFTCKAEAGSSVTSALYQAEENEESIRLVLLSFAGSQPTLNKKRIGLAKLLGLARAEGETWLQVAEREVPWSRVAREWK